MGKINHTSQKWCSELFIYWSMNQVFTTTETHITNSWIHPENTWGDTDTVHHSSSGGFLLGAGPTIIIYFLANHPINYSENEGAKYSSRSAWALLLFCQLIFLSIWWFVHEVLLTFFMSTLWILPHDNYYEQQKYALCLIKIVYGIEGYCFISDTDIKNT